MKKIFKYYLVLILTLFLYACSSNSVDDNHKIIVHRLGNTEIKGEINCVVVLDYAIIDALDNFHIEMNGIIKNDLPNYLTHLENSNATNVGSSKEVDLEKIAFLQPDIIITSSNFEDIYDKLNDIAPTVDLTFDYTHYLDSFESNMANLGKIFNIEELVDEEVTNLKDQIKMIADHNKANENNAIIIKEYNDNLDLFGNKSSYNILYSIFGFEQVDLALDDIESKKTSYDSIIEKDPNYIFVLSDNEYGFNKESLEELDAYIDDNIIELNIMATPTPTNCLCPVDISYSLGEFEKGTYVLIIKYFYEQFYSQTINF
jgi:iron complex transport system substrate-binding protein